MGRRLSYEIAQRARIIREPMVAGYIQELGLRLVSAQRERSFPFRFYVIEDREVNAFAIPGGHVYIHSGLIKAADNEAELASVMAHEIGHVILRHASQQMSAQIGYNTLASMLLGQNPGMWQALAANLLGTGALMSYSRQHEADADLFALRTLYGANYDLRGMLTLFEKLKRLEGREPNLLARFFSSHPATSERIIKARSTISSWPPQRSPIQNSAAFLRVKMRLEGR